MKSTTSLIRIWEREEAWKRPTAEKRFKSESYIVSKYGGGSTTNHFAVVQCFMKFHDLIITKVSHLPMQIGTRISENEPPEPGR